FDARAVERVLLLVQNGHRRGGGLSRVSQGGGGGRLAVGGEQCGVGARGRLRAGPAAGGGVGRAAAPPDGRPRGPGPARAPPRYFESHAKPVHPRDLTSHRCINFRHGSAGVYRWEFDKGKQSLTVAVNGPLIVDDVEIMVRAALDGVGLAFMSEDRAAPHLASGELVRVLEDWCPPFPGFFLYYPRQRQLPAALAALIETLRLYL